MWKRLSLPEEKTSIQEERGQKGKEESEAWHDTKTGTRRTVKMGHGSEQAFTYLWRGKGGEVHVWEGQAGSCPAWGIPGCIWEGNQHMPVCMPALPLPAYTLPVLMSCQTFSIL